MIMSILGVMFMTGVFVGVYLLCKLLYYIDRRLENRKRNKISKGWASAFPFFFCSRVKNIVYYGIDIKIYILGGIYMIELLLIIFIVTALVKIVKKK